MIIQIRAGDRRRPSIWHQSRWCSCSTDNFAVWTGSQPVSAEYFSLRFLLVTLSYWLHRVNTVSASDNRQCKPNCGVTWNNSTT